MRLSTDLSRREEGREMESEKKHDLFDYAMKGMWEKVVEIYEKYPNVREAKITKFEDTALHIAVTNGETATVLKLVEILKLENANASTILNMKNARGNTPLHLAAALGDVGMCQSMAKIDGVIITNRNVEGETPLFLAVLYGHEKAFLCLHSLYPEETSWRKSNGDTILHSAISGEYFSLAFQILHCYPNLANSVNENGLSPLHILASKPNAFRSSSRLSLFERIIYHCLIVDELVEKTEPPKAMEIFRGGSSTQNCPTNYETCVDFMRLLKTLFIKPITKSLKSFPIPAKCRKKNVNTMDEENQQGSRGAAKEAPSDHAKKSRAESAPYPTKDSFPPNYVTCVPLFKYIMKASLIILGVGIWKIKRIKEKKKRHIWAIQVMNKMIDTYTSYESDDPGSNPLSSRLDEDVSKYFTTPPSTENHEASKIANASEIKSTTASEDSQKERDQNSSERKDKHILVAAKLGLTEMMEKFLNIHPDAIQELNSAQKNLLFLTYEKKEPHEIGKGETPLLIAAKMGVTEIVQKILDRFPVAIWDSDSNNKNVVLLAIENRQPHIYKLLKKRESLKDSVFRQVDNQGNSALHLAATFGVYRPWLIPGGALQMQWEIKWYKFVKDSMPPHFFVKYNKKGQTPKDIFTDTHKDLVKDGSEWLGKTSESCSVVAALIATVAFATSSTIPGGVKEDVGVPTLEGKPAFNIFAISSLVALCSSVTALVFFLSILTSRYQEEDFAMDLPRKLLLGLTSLFTSIASILLSFCSGHFFVLKDDLRYVAYPIYAATCLPVSFFAFAQLPLYFDLIWAIFKKVPQRSYKVITL